MINSIPGHENVVELVVGQTLVTPLIKRLRIILDFPLRVDRSIPHAHKNSSQFAHIPPSQLDFSIFLTLKLYVCFVLIAHKNRKFTSDDHVVGGDRRNLRHD